ncbi:hypothetical protein GCM10010177_78530 [Actinomadura citrea]|nr:hypothetical protein GCM10010177_78530 [Actinomadura citrea]
MPWLAIRTATTCGQVRGTRRLILPGQPDSFAEADVTMLARPNRTPHGSLPGAACSTAPGRFNHSAWCATGPRHTQTAWLSAGYQARPNLTAQRVAFLQTAGS